MLYSSTAAEVVVRYNFPIKKPRKHKFKTHEKCESIVVNCLSKLELVSKNAMKV